MTIMKKKYNSPKINIVDVEVESLLNVVSSEMGGTTDTFGAKKRNMEIDDIDYIEDEEY